MENFYVIKLLLNEVEQYQIVPRHWITFKDENTPSEVSWPTVDNKTRGAMIRLNKLIKIGDHPTLKVLRVYATFDTYKEASNLIDIMEELVMIDSNEDGPDGTQLTQGEDNSIVTNVPVIGEDEHFLIAKIGQMTADEQCTSLFDLAYKANMRHETMDKQVDAMLLMAEHGELNIRGKTLSKLMESMLQMIDHADSILKIHHERKLKMQMLT